MNAYVIGLLVMLAAWLIEEYGTVIRVLGILAGVGMLAGLAVYLLLLLSTGRDGYRAGVANQ